MSNLRISAKFQSAGILVCKTRKEEKSKRLISFLETTDICVFTSEEPKCTFHRYGWQLLAYRLILFLTLWAPIPQNGQTYSNNSSLTANKLF